PQDRPRARPRARPCAETSTGTWARRSACRSVLGLALWLTSALRAAPARAYDPATTHAGLTERAVLASDLQRALSRRLSRPLGLFEPVVLRRSDLSGGEARSLGGRLDALDPAGGYRPSADGVAPALAWIVAGTVIAETPAERGQNLFFDPTRGNGLAQAGGVFGMENGLRMLFDAGGLRGAATGTNFNLTGRPSPEWLLAPENDVGLAAFYDQLELAVAGELPGPRGTALARALLALGGTLAVLEDAGEPAHVRNDFRAAFLESGGASPFDRGSPFERYVAETFGRTGVPAAGAPVSRPTVMAYLTASDRQGLADRTQRRFFSDGTLPEDGIVDRDTTGADVMRDARQSLAYGLPALPHLDLRGLGDKRYVYASAEADRSVGGAPPLKRRRLLAYLRVPGRVRFYLDGNVYDDTARTLLPEIGAYGAGLINHLFRAEIHLDVAGDVVAVSVTDPRGDLRKGEVRLYAEDATGRRHPMATTPAATTPTSFTIPAGTRRIAAVLRGQDVAGELVAVAEQPVR
ncbi:MAG TPA: hypothetical protein VFG23_15910, partial [Polyangia bacterium]|nr:hypothetical protein [Polyangia bacterium]